MRTLGIDPGMALLGWSIVDSKSSQPTLVDYGVLKTQAGESFTKRLTTIYSNLQKLIESFAPNVLAIETLYFVKNAKTLAQVGHVRGIILLAAGQANLEVYEYSPKQVKLALTGYGGAEKHQMQKMVQRLFGIDHIPQPDDAADAVAIALCHTQFIPSNRKPMVTV
jgi:crossover junction endodeoxyribonuclease RuvC